MKKRKEFLLLKKCCRYLDDMQYPGYQFFCRFGIIDFKTKDCWVDSRKTSFVTDSNFHKFTKYFVEGLLYNILESNFAQKGSWLYSTQMDSYKTFLEKDWEDEDGDPNFYIGNQGLVRLYYAVYAAICEFKNTDKILFFAYDGDSMDDTACVEVFDNYEEIEQYYKEYFLGE